MNLKFTVREVRLLVLTGAVVFAIGIGASSFTSVAGLHTTAHEVRQVVDGSESTGKPPKPKPSHFTTARFELVDGSESTGKPPKPKPNHLIGARLLLADGSESTSKPPKPKTA